VEKKFTRFSARGAELVGLEFERGFPIGFTYKTTRALKRNGEKRN